MDGPLTVRDRNKIRKGSHASNLAQLFKTPVLNEELYFHSQTGPLV